MEPFLKSVAEEALRFAGSDLKNHCFVFPNRRSALFFSRYLAELAGKPVWSPSITTISELFSSFSNLRIAENDILSFELYKVYSALNTEAESFDSFYYWGEMLASDFDNVDKYLVDSKRLFSNIRDLKEIDRQFGSLTPEQAAIVKEFWVHFDIEQMTDEKKTFLSIWNILPGLYDGLRETLRRKGLAYEGMIFRDLAELCSNGLLPHLRYSCYHFTGFNALNSCEKIFLGELKSRGIARFYWDFHSSFMEDKTHPAGFFMRQNIKEFGNDLPSATANTAFERLSGWKIIDTPSDISQVKLASSILSECSDLDEENGHKTAVVLSDENLIVPMLSSLPQNANPVNITMGFPLRYSPIYSLVRSLFRMALTAVEGNDGLSFQSEEVIKVLKHSWIIPLYEELDLNIETVERGGRLVHSSFFRSSGILETVFSKPSDNDSAALWLRTILEALFYVKPVDDEGEDSEPENIEALFRNEFIYRSCMAINRLKTVAAESSVKMSVSTWFRLCDKVLRSLSVPFSGEPLSGLQVMGILETRSLDFKRVIILSVNEGILPKTSTAASVIPHNLREAFGLPASRHQDSIYAYYFYRLLARAEDVTFIYNSNSSGLKTGEMSRFLLQLKYLNENSPKTFTLSPQLHLPGKPVSLIVRTPRHNSILENKYLGNAGSMLSPSAVNSWLNCTMKFFYRYIAGIKEPEKTVKEIDPATFGTVLHTAMESLYSQFRGRVIQQAELKKLALSAAETENAVNKAMPGATEALPGGPADGSSLLVSSVLQRYVRNIIEYDSGIAPFSLESLEEKVSARFEVDTGDRKILLTSGGVIDRLDIIQGVTRVVDYKTGNTDVSIPSVESLFDRDNEKRSDEWFQVLMYCEILSQSGEITSVRPGLYSVREIHSGEYSDMLTIKRKGEENITINDYSIIRDDFRSYLLKVFREIFAGSNNFEMTPVTDRCSFCSYRKMCSR